ncbi:MAG: DUF1847 domain-containing protein, partial [Acidobacteria bacterium]|nr:DUF1847 domain-containing protein [Acidobacteriota bacterium]
SCPTLNGRDLVEESRREYQKPTVREFARLASVQEGECYLERERRPYIPHCGKTRIQEVCEFAHKIGAGRLGLAFCIGLAQEARQLHEIFTAQGFEVASVGCKAGRVLKEEVLGVKDEQKILIGTPEAACNPINQARVLNRAGTDLNVLVGLCVGHDALFFKYAEAYTTVLAVKDRVTGHNPLAALYTSHLYYMFLRRPGF